MSRLQDSVILLSGAGTALGYALVERCLAEGARVTVLEADAERATQLQDDFGLELLVVNADPRTFAAHQQALDLTLTRHRRLDGFVANSACWDRGFSLAELPADESLRAGFEAIFSANVWRYVCGARVVSASLRQYHGSMVLALAGAGGALTAAARHAGVGLVRQLALELAPAVRVNGVCTLRAGRELDSPFAALATTQPSEPAFEALAPRYVADATAQVEHFISLLAPASVSSITGTVIECAAADIEGLVTLA